MIYNANTHFTDSINKRQFMSMRNSKALKYSGFNSIIISSIKWFQIPLSNVWRPQFSSMHIECCRSQHARWFNRPRSIAPLYFGRRSHCCCRYCRHGRRPRDEVTCIWVFVCPLNVRGSMADGSWRRMTYGRAERILFWTVTGGPCRRIADRRCK